MDSREATATPLPTLEQSPIARLTDDLLRAILRLLVQPDGLQQHALVSKHWHRVACGEQKEIHVASERGIDAGRLLTQISSFPNLKTLLLPNRSLRLVPRFLTRLADTCPSLVKLHLGEAKRGDFKYGGLQQLLRTCTRLEDLSLLWGLWESPLPPAICNLSLLTTLHLNFDVDRLPDQFTLLRSLQHLKLRMRKLQHLPADLGNLTHLKSLTLDGCHQLASLPDSIQRLVSLEDLLRSGNCTFQLPHCLPSLVSLKRLEFESFQLLPLPEGVGKLTALETLTLRCAGFRTPPGSFTRLPNSLPNLTSLTDLDLVMPCLAALPRNFGRIPHLRILSLECKGLTALPSSLTRASALQQLSLRYLPITALPSDIGRLTALERLKLDWLAQLTQLPESIGQLTRLRELSIVGSELERLPDSICQLSALERLVVQSSKLTALPDSIGDSLKRLRHLRIYCESLTHLPPSLFRLSSLETLAFGKLRRIRGALFEGFSALTNLTSLEMGGCTQLQQLPDGIGRLLALEILYLSDLPALTSLPRSLLHLPRLRVLHIYDCPRLSSFCTTYNLPAAATTRGTAHGSSSTGNSGSSSTGNSGSSSTGNSGSSSTGNSGSSSGGSSIILEGCEAAVLPSLQDLQFWAVGFTSLGPSFAGWSSLRSLHITRAHYITTLPGSMGGLSALTSLRLIDLSALRELPESMGHVSRLESIHIEGCSQVERLPESFVQLTNLRDCTLYDLQISSLPADFGRLASLWSLKLIDLPRLRCLPDSLLQLRLLECLVVRCCAQLAHIPPALRRLPSLHHCEFARRLMISDCPRLRFE